MNLLIKRIRPFNTSAVWAMEKVVVAKKKEYQEVLPENISKQNARARAESFYLFICLLCYSFFDCIILEMPFAGR